jgi:hypothetical protein
LIRRLRNGHGDGRKFVLGSLFGLLFEFAKIFSHFETPQFWLWDSFQRLNGKIVAVI